MFRPVPAMMRPFFGHGQAAASLPQLPGRNHPHRLDVLRERAFGGRLLHDIAQMLHQEVEAFSRTSRAADPRQEVPNYSKRPETFIEQARD